TEAHEFLAADHLDQARHIARATERDLHVQLVAQRGRWRRIEHPGLEVIDSLFGRLVDRSGSRAARGARPQLAGAAHEFVAAQLIERRVDAGGGEARGAKTLIEALRQLIPVPGALDHESQHRMLGRHSRPSWSTVVYAEATRISDFVHSNHAMNQTEWNFVQVDDMCLSGCQPHALHLR